MSTTEQTGDEGNAMIEFVYLAVLLLIPLVYVLLAAFQVQRAAFGVTEAARQAGRAYARAPEPGTGTARAAAASRLALADQGMTGDAPLTIGCQDTCLAPGSTVRVRVSYTVRLPGVSFLLPSGAGIPVRASHVEVVDTFQGVR